MSDTLVRVLAFTFGAMWGSFLNVCISRWPAGQSVVAPRSRCPNCERPIAWYENVPVLSWVALRARCRGCGKPISVMYPLVELAVAFIWLISVVNFGPTLTALRVAVFATLLLGIAMTDARHYTIPDGFTVFGLLWIMAFSVVGLITAEPGPFAPPYEALRRNAARYRLNGFFVLVASIDDLLSMKRAAGRSSDVADVEALEAIRQRRN